MKIEVCEEIDYFDLDDSTVVRIFRNQRGDFVISRYSKRSKVENHTYNYELISEDQSFIKKLDLEHAQLILKRLRSGATYNGAFIFYSQDHNNLVEFELPEKSQEEHKYTSTGIKFWRHQESLEAYKNRDPNTVISTHISPEGACNLRCPYCSVSYRETHNRLDLETIQNYVRTLKEFGLRAVILTGGGEPTSYKYFNELVRWIHAEGLKVALITNGTLSHRVSDDVWPLFTWIRVSINIFDGWEQRIRLPLEHISEKTIVGCSFVFTIEHESVQEMGSERLDILKRVSAVADNCGAKYIRLLPNCLLEQEDLKRQHMVLEKVLHQVEDKRFFHQYKVHGAPKSSVCHQSYFRPYLSEESHTVTGRPGAVYPCDSVVLNDSATQFKSEYQLCHASDISSYMKRKISQNFDASIDCKGCVFTDNVNMLQDYISDGKNKFNEFLEPIEHEEFI